MSSQDASSTQDASSSQDTSSTRGQPVFSDSVFFFHNVHQYNPAQQNEAFQIKKLILHHHGIIEPREYCLASVLIDLHEDPVQDPVQGPAETIQDFAQLGGTRISSLDQFKFFLNARLFKTKGRPIVSSRDNSSHTHPSIKAAAHFTGVSPAAIRAALSSPSSSVSGYSFSQAHAQEQEQEQWSNSPALDRFLNQADCSSDSSQASQKVQCSNLGRVRTKNGVVQGFRTNASSKVRYTKLGSRTYPIGLLVFINHHNRIPQGHVAYNPHHTDSEGLYSTLPAHLREIPAPPTSTAPRPVHMLTPQGSAIQKFTSISAAAAHTNLSRFRIRRAIASNSPLKGFYFVHPSPSESNPSPPDLNPAPSH